MELRGYQQTIIDETEAMLAFDDKVVIGASMGAGKSLLIAENARATVAEGKSAVVLTNLTALIPQLARHLDELGVAYNVVKAGAHESNGAKVNLIMEQSFHEKARAKLNIECDVLIKDEAHIGVGQKRFEDIVRDLDPDQEIYYTGTPYDEKGFLMHGISKDQIIMHGTPAELTEQGYLAPLHYFIPKWAEQIDYSEAGTSGADYSGAGLDGMLDTFEHTNLILKAMGEMNAKGKKTLVYANSIEHATALATALEIDGYAVGLVHSKIDSETNAKTIANFKGVEQWTARTLENPDGKRVREVDCLVSVSALTVGFDAPAAELLVLCRPTKVLRLYLQIVGRVARTNPGKPYGEVLDLAQCVSTHGFFTEARPLIERGDKNGLRTAKEEMSVDSIDSLVGDEPTEITRERVDVHVRELLQKSLRVPEMTMEELLSFYDTTHDMRTIIWIAYEMYSRIAGLAYTPASVDWVLEAWVAMLLEFPDYKHRLVKTLRTRAKNIVKQRKKLAALYYFPDWLRDQSPYNMVKQVEDFRREDQYPNIEIDEDEIPF